MSRGPGPGRKPLWARWRRQETQSGASCMVAMADMVDPSPPDAGMASFNKLFEAAAPAAGQTPSEAAKLSTPGTATAETVETARTAPARAEVDPELCQVSRRHNGAGFLVPSDLTRSGVLPKKVALIGSCFLSAWNIHGRNKDTCKFDVFTVNHGADLPDGSNPEEQAYDFQIIQIPMRSFFPDGMISRLGYHDVAGHETALGTACNTLAFLLKGRMKWNIQHGLLTFVTNFPVPQRNMLGTLFPRFDIRNPEHFVHRLNESLEAMVREYSNAYVLDIDRICASYGRRYIQDDVFTSVTHNSILGLDGPVLTRLEPVGAMRDHYDIEWPNFLADAIWAEAVSMYRIVRQADTVKMVIVDLDDTLWHGVSGEMEHVGDHMLAGWPKGLAEALLYLKKRGVILAIVSKNDEQRIRAIWPKIFHRTLALEDFALTRINWQPKAENIQEILLLANLLPRSVVFIDDNPGERAAVQTAFPDIRVLGRHPYYLRRILLWSPETQTASVSGESALRTEMVQAQVLRENKRQDLSREAFLSVAAPRIKMSFLSDGLDPRFARVLELINRTNQFNTTGRRRTREELQAFFSAGGRIMAFEVTDLFTAYGLVGAILLDGSCILQWVMSCRVLGYDIEIAVMSVILSHLKSIGSGDVSGLLIETETNFPCRDLFSRCGFQGTDGKWVSAAGRCLEIPSHIHVEETELV